LAIRCIVIHIKFAINTANIKLDRCCIIKNNKKSKYLRLLFVLKNSNSKSFGHINNTNIPIKGIKNRSLYKLIIESFFSG